MYQILGLLIAKPRLYIILITVLIRYYTLQIRPLNLVFLPQPLNSPPFCLRFPSTFLFLSDFFSRQALAFYALCTDSSSPRRGHGIGVLAASFFFMHPAIFFEDDIINLLDSLSSNPLGYPIVDPRIIRLYPSFHDISPQST